MRLFRLRRFAFAFWLGLLALTASGVAQNQLSTNVLAAALTDNGAHAHHAAGHYMPDGTFMPGNMPGEMHTAQHQQQGGHTHKGHSDCTMCSAVAAMAGLSTTVVAVLLAPQVNAALQGWTSVRTHLSASFPASYSSRAPPILIG